MNVFIRQQQTADLLAAMLVDSRVPCSRAQQRYTKESSFSCPVLDLPLSHHSSAQGRPAQTFLMEINS